MKAVPLSPEQLALNAARAAELLAALGADGPVRATAPRPLTQLERELIDGMHALEREIRQTPLDAETRVDRLRQLAIAQRREPRKLAEVIGPALERAKAEHRRNNPRPYAIDAYEDRPAAPTEEQLEQHHGDAAE